MMRAARALARALYMSLRGESIAPAHYQALEAWMDAVGSELSTVIKSADAAGFDQYRRQNLQLKLDGRLTSFEQTLEMIRHNLQNEYPRLIRLDDRYSMMVVGAINMNDQYRVGRFLEDSLIKDGPLRQALESLNERLLNLPEIAFPEPLGGSKKT